MAKKPAIETSMPSQTARAELMIVQMKEKPIRTR